ncbi:MAG TPA: hypothetical protein VII55_01125 [Candidatus Saccharimonadales bacterium]
MNKPKFNIGEPLEKVGSVLRQVRHYGFALFLLFVALIYGFVLLRINTLGNAQPSSDAVTSQVQAARIPHIDQPVVQQLQSLQDNSVSVKSLFNQARANPFQE